VLNDTMQGMVMLIGTIVLLVGSSMRRVDYIMRWKP
jgi:Na+/pantothenate symporter